MSLVKRIQTTPSQASFDPAARMAWLDVVGLPAPPMVRAILFAQFAFETGWGKFCWNWNLGNVRTGPLDPPTKGGWAGDYMEIPGADEYVNGKRVIVGGTFRSAATLADGALDHIRFLSSLARYGRAFAILVSARDEHNARDVNAFASGFVGELKAGGYFTGDVTSYANGVASIAHSFLTQVSEIQETNVPEFVLHALDPRRYQQDWTPRFDAADFVKTLATDGGHTPESYAHMTGLLCNRWDCADAPA